jgi:hypothetical protein
LDPAIEGSLIAASIRRASTVDWRLCLAGVPPRPGRLPVFPGARFDLADDLATTMSLRSDAFREPDPDVHLRAHLAPPDGLEGARSKDCDPLAWYATPA